MKLLIPLNVLMRAAEKADPLLCVQAEALEGHTIAIAIQEGPTILGEIKQGHLRFQPHDGREASLHLTGTLLAFIKAARAIAEDKPLIGLGLTISGDVGLATQFQAIYGSIAHDVSALLEPWLGTTLSGMLTSMAGTLHARLKEPARSMRAHAQLWLQEEADILPSYPEFEHWQAEVRDFSQAVERIEARIRRQVL